MHKGLLVVYSGPSGVGKGTVLAPYLQAHPEAVLSVSMTTRAPRPGETDGVEYHFVSRAAFEEQIVCGGLLEYAQYSGNYYGTPRRMVENELAQGRDVVLEIEVQGAMQIRKTYPDAIFVFVLPPSYESLRKRLQGRGTEETQVMERRLEAAQQELLQADQYEYLIVNDTPQSAREKFEAIILAEKCKTKNMKHEMEKVCESI